ncbi:MAG: hypothetical protein GTN53_22980 [Candidatus Aminicenantes bacterium]|nr:hypothetical protein [Candidatus Aminicenantes bacterium]NIQ69368.1 hypothetical protein [Candidatus Aminicenantes bacterium]NIT25369.1 hypothetical protein [Candidatus Aminicenantes bacterium]
MKNKNNKIDIEKMQSARQLPLYNTELPPYGKKGYINAPDAPACDRAVKIAIKALDKVVMNLNMKKYTKDTKELALLAQLELKALYE